MVSPPKGFVGRDKEIRLFARLLEAAAQPRPETIAGQPWLGPSTDASFISPSDYRLVVLGQAGVGKSALLRAFAEMARDAGIPAVLVGIDAPTVLSAIDVLAHDLSAEEPEKSLFPSLLDLIQKYLNLERKLEQDSGLGPQTLGLISRASEFPLLVTPTSPTSAKHEDDPSSRSLRETAVDVIYSVLGLEDGNFFIEPEAALTDAMITDIQTYERESNRTVCILFDRFERFSLGFREWLRKSLIGRLPWRIIIVVAGRMRATDEEWALWSNPEPHFVELLFFSAKEVQGLLKANGFKRRKELAHHIMELSGGWPFYASLAIRQLKARNTESPTALPAIHFSERYLREVLPEAQVTSYLGVLEACSILRWFNEESLTYMIEGVPASQVMQFAREHLIMESRGQLRFALHDSIRDAVTHELKASRSRRFRELQMRAASMYGQWLERSGTSERRGLTLERFYHLLQAYDSELTAMLEMQRTFFEAADLFQLGFCGEMVDMCEQMKLEDDSSLAWVDCYKGALAWHRADYLGAASLLEPLISRPSVQGIPLLRCLVTYYLSIAKWYLCYFQEALQLSMEAVQLARDADTHMVKNRALEIAGITHDRLGDFGQAIARQEEHLAECVGSQDQIGEAWGLNNLGYFLWHAGRWNESEDRLLACKSMWVKLGVKFGEAAPSAHLGLVYLGASEFDRADKALSQALQLTTMSGNREIASKTHQNRAEYFRRLRRYEEAIKSVQEAYRIAADPSMAHKYYQADTLRIWGEIYGSMGQFGLASDKLTESLEISTALEARYLRARCLVDLYTYRDQDYALEAASGYEDIRAALELGSYHQLSARLEAVHAKRVALDDPESAARHLAEAWLYAVKHNWYTVVEVTSFALSMFASLYQFDKRRQLLLLCDAVVDFWAQTKRDGTPLPELERHLSNQRVSGTSARFDSSISKLESQRDYWYGRIRH